MNGLTELRVKNYRSLADISLDIRPVNLLFGPNGSGKSTLLDSLYFFQDCAIRGVDVASSERSHGIGLLWDGADEGANIELALATADVDYALTFGLSSGRIEPFAGERLHSKRTDTKLIGRKVGSTQALIRGISDRLPGESPDKPRSISLREPEKLFLAGYRSLDSSVGSDDSAYLDNLLHFLQFYHTRSFSFYRLKQDGSRSDPGTRLSPRGDNAWSVLRNLHGRSGIDDGYDTIMQYMRESFPTFDGIVLEQTGPNSVYASFLETGRREPILASGVSDGHMQMLLLLIALFSEGKQDAVILFDEPEISLHPWPLAVLAKAIKHAATEWKKQVFVATHSPVLMSQFEPDQVLVTQVEDGRTQIKRLSQIDEIQDLLEHYALGSLYMSGAIAPQEPDPMQVEGE